MLNHEFFELDDELLCLACSQAEEQLLSELPVSEEEQHVFSARFEGKMRRLLKNERRTPALRLVNTVARRAALFALVLGVGAFSVTMSVGALRDRFLEFFRETTGGTTAISYRLEGAPEGLSIEGTVIHPNYLPEGYKLVNISTGTYNQELTFANGEDDLFTLEETLLVSGSMMLDTQQEGTEDITVSSEGDGFLYQRGEQQVLAWVDEEYLFRLSGELDRDTLLEVARSVEPFGVVPAVSVQVSSVEGDRYYAKVSLDITREDGEEFAADTVLDYLSVMTDVYGTGAVELTGQVDGDTIRMERYIMTSQDLRGAFGDVKVGNLRSESRDETLLGVWQTNFQVEVEDLSQPYRADTSPLGEGHIMTMERFMLSPYTLYFQLVVEDYDAYSRPRVDAAHEAAVAIRLKDGTEVEAPVTSIFGTNADDAGETWLYTEVRGFDRPINLDEVEALVIDGVACPLEQEGAR